MCDKLGEVLAGEDYSHKNAAGCCTATSDWWLILNCTENHSLWSLHSYKSAPPPKFYNDRFQTVVLGNLSVEILFLYVSGIRRAVHPEGCSLLLHESTSLTSTCCYSPTLTSSLLPKSVAEIMLTILLRFMPPYPRPSLYNPICNLCAASSFP
jgi:hypothetical protein